jgi:hypothetical protein
MTTAEKEELRRLRRTNLPFLRSSLVAAPSALLIAKPVDGALEVAEFRRKTANVSNHLLFPSFTALADYLWTPSSRTPRTACPRGRTDLERRYQQITHPSLLLLLVPGCLAACGGGGAPQKDPPAVAATDRGSWSATRATGRSRPTYRWT